MISIVSEDQIKKLNALISQNRALDPLLYETIFSEVDKQVAPQGEVPADVKSEFRVGERGDVAAENLSSANVQLFEQIKEVEQQLERMTQHWRTLRTREASKKKERALKISKGEVVKRRRRTAQGIKRRYLCPVTDCGKSYGSDGSLNQHIRLKHPLEFDEFRKLKFQSVIAASYDHDISTSAATPQTSAKKLHPASPK